MMNTEIVYNERTAILPLSEGKSVLVRGVGNSMTPRFISGQILRVDPITPDVILSKGDAVLAKVNGRFYLHKITAIRLPLYQISNNHGHINGWTKQIYGKVKE
jgi:phage repressor protein C with HTH and peptisase S24 domain